MDDRALPAGIAIRRRWQAVSPVCRLALAILLASWLGSQLPANLALPVAVLALVILPFARTRPAALFLLLLALCAWRLAPPEIPSHSCHVDAHVRDFPDDLPPRAQRIPVHIDASADCPQLVGENVTLFEYDRRELPLASRWHMRIALRLSDNRVTGTLQDATALPPAAHSLAGLRATLDARIRARFHDRHARWLQALLIGNRTALHPADRNLLRETGTTHLLAISGLHVGLIALMAYWAGKTLISLNRRLMLAIAPRSGGYAFMLLATLLYVILSGAQPPALRAWIMLAGVSLAWFTPRVQSGVEGLALAAAVSLLLEPAILNAPSAWLSYLATLTVIIAWQRYRDLPALVQWPLIQGWITLALTPLIWAWFGGVSLIAPVANLIVIPWLGCLLLAGFLAIAFAPVIHVAQTLLDHTLATLQALANLPAAHVEPFWQPGTTAALAAYLLSLALLARWPRKTRMALTLLLLAACLWPLRPQAPVLYQTPNGNAAILHTREGSLVINPGYRYRERDDARRYLLPELRRRARAPVAILITADKKRQHSALKTLLDAYPQTPVISLVPLKDYPFAVAHCPPNPPLPAGWQLEHCTLLTPAYRIDRHGIHPRAP